ncbi:hypothetical protein BGX12_15610 [Fibrobacter sp. UWR4]|nr:hypothetical protein BGX12_15610 [Fibrobacter sp. UWR4]PZW62746.1 hypothetical protein C8E88_105610 [Fibrobacter sp. UWR1]
MVDRLQQIFTLKCLFLLVLFFAGFTQAEIIRQDKSTRPTAQDSVFKTPWGIDPAPRETDAGRWVLPLREVMQRTYDVSGQKSEWVLGTSILGNPELDASSMGMATLSRRYPSKLAGLYTTRLSFDGSTLNLNGDNGILLEEPKGIAVDTPVTDLNWERPAFSGNALHLDFRRLITDSVTLDLGLSAHSNVDSKEYSYTNVTHSPYFALGRDSTQIPFGGRNIAMNSMHIQPTLTWRFGYGKAFAKVNYFSLENADNTNHKVQLDTLDKSIRTFLADPYTIDIKAMTYGAGVEFYPIKGLTISTDITYGEHEIEEDSLARVGVSVEEYYDTLGYVHRDTTFYDTAKTINYQTVYGNAGVSYHTILNPALKFSYEFLNGSSDGSHKETMTYQQDRELGYVELSDTLGGWFLFRTQAGMQRNSSVLDTVEFAKAYSVDVLALLPFHLRLNGTYRHDNRFPDLAQLKFGETGRLAFPNKDLKFEERDRATLNAGWQMRDVFYGLGFRFENADNLIKPAWVKEGEVDSTSRLDEVYRWENIDNVKSLDWILQVGFRLGNWKFYLERGETLDRNRILLDTPRLYYKGSIHWQNRFVQDRLGVSVRVDWQWFGDRYDCTINEFGNPELEYMKKYLALDFEARMQILTFELYSRIENFNHSIYMPESGYTPEGLRIAYGIVWTFGN